MSVQERFNYRDLWRQRREVLRVPGGKRDTWLNSEWTPMRSVPASQKALKRRGETAKFTREVSSYDGKTVEYVVWKHAGIATNEERGGAALDRDGAFTKTIRLANGESITWQHTGAAQNESKLIEEADVSENLPALAVEQPEVAEIQEAVMQTLPVLWVPENKPRHKVHWSVLPVFLAVFGGSIAGSAALDAEGKDPGVFIAQHIDRLFIAGNATVAEAKAWIYSYMTTQKEAALATLRQQVASLEPVCAATNQCGAETQYVQESTLRPNRMRLRLGEAVEQEAPLQFAADSRTPTRSWLGESVAMAAEGDAIGQGGPTGAIEPPAEIASIATSDVTATAIAGDTLGRVVTRFSASFAESCTEQCPVVTDELVQDVLRTQVAPGANAEVVSDVLAGAGILGTGQTAIHLGDTVRMDPDGRIAVYVGNTHQVRFTMTREAEIRQAGIETPANGA